MFGLQKYYNLWLFFIISCFFYTSCGFPFHTKQAREARKAAKIAARTPAPIVTKNDRMQSTARTDSLSIIATADTNNTTTDSNSLSNPNAIIDSIPVVALDTPFVYTPVQDSVSFAVNDTIPTIALDSPFSYTAAIDSIPMDGNPDSIPLIWLDTPFVYVHVGDSIPMTGKQDSINTIRYSPDSIAMAIQYEAADSMVYDIVQRKVYMYGNAQVYFEQYELKAGYIEFDFKTNVAMATCLVDSTGNEVECPIFDDKQQTFDSRRIEFNFKTKKGKVYDASTQQGDGYLVSNSTKFISGEGGDVNNIIYSKGALYTTCNHEHPHFGIRASQAKIIPNKLIVVGPSFLEIMGSPTPILLPFGFFPLTKNKRSGLILSPDLDFSPALGPGLRGNGFYIGLSEYWDLKVTGDFYLRGSMRAYVNSNYNVRYKGQGNVTLGYTRLQQDEPGTPDYSLTQSFNINWTHTQSPQAHPSQTFTANVNFGTSDYFTNTFNDAENVLQANINSRISYTKRFEGTPFSLSTNFAHTLVTNTRQMTIRFPNMTLAMNQIYPFKRKKAAGASKWYERIGFSYSTTASNVVQTTDTTFFAPGGFEEALDDMNYNVTHSPRINMSFKLFKFINLNPTINYSQNWYFYRNRQFLDPTPVLNDAGTDTTQFGTVETRRDYGFYTTHNFNAGVSLNTQIYATGDFNIGPLKSIRAVFTPDVGFRWRPDYTNVLDYYGDSVQTDTRYPTELRRYNYFYSYAPPTGREANLTYGLNARFDAKVKKGKRDSTLKSAFKKIVLIPNFSINGSYNMAADSLHFSTINLNTYTTLFNKINVRFSATFDPYAANRETNARINTFEFTESKRLVRTTSMSFNASTSFNSRDLRQLFKGKKKNKDKKTNEPQFELLNNIAIDYNFIVNNRYVDGIDTALVTAHQLAFSGTVNLSKGWNIRVGRIGYDFVNERITYPDFTFSRDLHCWTMGLSWQPERQTWSFFLKVKPGSLGFLEVPVQKEFYERF